MSAADLLAADIAAASTASREALQVVIDRIRDESCQDFACSIYCEDCDTDRIEAGSACGCLCVGCDEPRTAAGACWSCGAAAYELASSYPLSEWDRLDAARRAAR